jgi:DNA-binding NtrC family response regulator
LPRNLRDQLAAPPPRGDGFNLFESEKRLLLDVLERTGWNQTKTAEMLGISRKQLRTRMKNHDLLRTPGRLP